MDQRAACISLGEPRHALPAENRNSDPMKPIVHYYHIQTPDGLSMTFIGGDLVAAGDGYVWLTRPWSNEPILRVPCACVHQSSPEETAARILADAQNGTLDTRN
jgi:hypothetical protein